MSLIGLGCLPRICPEQLTSDRGEESESDPVSCPFCTLSQERIVLRNEHAGVNAQ
jgi:hypothetical protein